MKSSEVASSLRIEVWKRHRRRDRVSLSIDCLPPLLMLGETRARFRQLHGKHYYQPGAKKAILGRNYPALLRSCHGYGAGFGFSEHDGSGLVCGASILRNAGPASDGRKPADLRGSC